MIDNNIIFENKKAKDNTKALLGISGENEQERLVFSFADGFVDGICNLEIEYSDGYKGCIEELEKDVENECYRLTVKNCLLTQAGWISMQLKIIQENKIWKSFIFKMFVEHAIKATETIEEQYPTFVEITKTRMREMEQGFEQLTEKTNKAITDLESSKENIKTNTEDIEKLKEDIETNTTNITKANEGIEELQESKADRTELFSKDYNDLLNKPVIPSVQGLASENFVKEEIEKIKVPEIDLTGYATQGYVDNKIGDIESLLAEV